MNLKAGDEDRPVFLDFPPDPLHVIILGAPIDALDKLELHHPEEMAKFYSLLRLKKSGTSAGGIFDGPSVKKIIVEKNFLFLKLMNKI